MKKTSGKNALTLEQAESLLAILKARFDKNKGRHKGIAWPDVLTKLDNNPRKLWSIGEMEESGGEPDVTGHDKKTGEFLFVDCAAETPKGRRSVCYDREGLESRKEFKPDNTAIDLAETMGIEMLTEEEYHDLQKLGDFDLKTSSWLKTPAEIRKHGGAIFGDKRYGRVFVYHNGAQSYYAGRAFRGAVRI